MSNMVNVWNSSIKRTIDEWGTTINIIYGSTSECNSCGYDPINKEATNVACDTCDGLYYYQTENDWYIQAAMNSFANNKGSVDYSLGKYGYVPESDARLTIWLDDILMNLDSATGWTYIDRSIRIEAKGKKYVVQNTERIGPCELTVMVATLREQK